MLVLGAGAAGSNAARVALGMGARVTILDINPQRLLPFEGVAKTILSSPDAIKEEVPRADLIIGAVLIPGALAPKLLTKEILRTAKPGAVLVDIAIDQGGIAETSRPTTIETPTFVEEGVVHYCVANMPALVPRTSTLALTSATLPWIKVIAELGPAGAVESSQPLKHSLLTRDGKLLNTEVSRALGM